MVQQIATRGGHMPTATRVPHPRETEEPIQRIPMSLAEYMELPEKPKSEWVEGVALIMPPARPKHGALQFELSALLGNSLRNCHGLVESGLRMPNSRRVPDIMIVDNLTDAVWIDSSPIILAEIISPATRTQDMINKAAEYAAKGAGQYWIVDREFRLITILLNRDGQWKDAIEVNDEHPVADIPVGEYGTVHLDLNALLDGL